MSLHCCYTSLHLLTKDSLFVLLKQCEIKFQNWQASVQYTWKLHQVLYLVNHQPFVVDNVESITAITKTHLSRLKSGSPAVLPRQLTCTVMKKTMILRTMMTQIGPAKLQMSRSDVFNQQLKKTREQINCCNHSHFRF